LLLEEMFLELLRWWPSMQSDEERIWETDKGSIPVLACFTVSNRAGAQKP
jgi:hypothetical protein